jgi:dUTP pyrophosphatase
MKRKSLIMNSDRAGLPILQLPHAEGLPLPAYATDDSAGMDLMAALDHDNPLTLASGERGLIPTGLIMEIPKGFEGQVRPRSGLALKHGVTVLNAPGTIDADYRGEVQVILINHGQTPFTIERGMRIAQLIIAPVTQVTLAPQTSLSTTARGSGGFGSTGIQS